MSEQATRLERCVRSSFFWVLLATIFLCGLESIFKIGNITLSEARGWKFPFAYSWKLSALVLLLLGLWLIKITVFRPGSLFQLGGGEVIPPEPESHFSHQFPHGATKVVALWLAVCTGLSLAGFFAVLNPPSWFAAKPGGTPASDVNNALTTMFAGAVGACISTINAYLMHASTKRDFDTAYVPYYLARPLMGLLLGLVFYFVLAGGLVFITGADDGSADGGGGGINRWGLAAAGALVGMFSREAILKLQEVFHTIFHTKEQVLDEEVEGLRDRFDKLAGTVKNEILEISPEIRRAIVVNGSGEALIEAVAKISDADFAKLSDGARGFLSEFRKLEHDAIDKPPSGRGEGRKPKPAEGTE